MKLSEAIRLGAMMRPQRFCGPLSVPVDAKDGSRSCVLEAASEAVGDPVDVVYATRRWLILSEHAAPCPVCLGRAFNFAQVIALHLNDLHMWTREQIADWVETQEKLLEVPQGEPILTTDNADGRSPQTEVLV